MTETEWLSATTPGPMLDYLVEHAEIATERKLRLLAAGWCRDIVYLLPRNKRRWTVSIRLRWRGWWMAATKPRA